MPIGVPGGFKIECGFGLTHRAGNTNPPPVLVPWQYCVVGSPCCLIHYARIKFRRLRTSKLKHVGNLLLIRVSSVTLMRVRVHSTDECIGYGLLHIGATGQTAGVS